MDFPLSEGEQDHAAGALRYLDLGAGAEWQYDAGDLVGGVARYGGAGDLVHLLHCWRNLYYYQHLKSELYGFKNIGD